MSEYIAETFEHAGYTVKLIQDRDAEAPANDDEVFIVTTKNRYFVVDQDGFDLDVIRDGEHSDKYHVFPLYAYIHSGVALSLRQSGQFADQWDSGQIGYCLVSRDSFGDDPKHVEWGVIPNAWDAAKTFVETWNQYLSGDVWGYTVEDSDAGEHVDSCWGFYGIDYVRKEAKESAEVCRKHEVRQAEGIAAMMHV